VPYLTYLTFSLLENQIELQEIAFELAQGITAIFVLSRLSRLILEPHRPQERYWKIKDQYSLMIHTFIQYFSVIGIGGYAVTRSLLELGMPDDLNLRLLHFIAFILCSALITWVIRYKNVYNYLEKHEIPKNFRIAPYLRAIILNSWHLPLIALFITIYVDFCGVVPQAQNFIGGLFLTILIIIAVAFLETKISFFRTHLLQKTPQFHPPFLTQLLINEPQKIDHFTVIALYGSAVLVLLEIWNISLISWITSGAAQIVLQKITAISLIFLGVFAILRAGNYLFEKYSLNLHHTDDHASARIKTVIAILRNSLRIGVWIPAIFLIISEIGFDIKPLVASFSFFTLAIGFGAQNLVKDIITGLFIILEDTISVGDLVKLDGLTGLVEALTIRTIALREEDGTLHTIPFSSISKVSNSTRHYSCAVIMVKVSYKEDISRIFETCRQVYNTMKSELPWSRIILGPLEIKGVEDFQETGIVIKVIIRTLASKNSDVRREFNQRIKVLFDKEGILLGTADRVFDVVLRPTPPNLIS
jgi:small conductance mechanosensitive channel